MAARGIVNPRSQLTGIAFASALAIGAAHEAEHVIQVVQRYVFAVPNGNGVLGSVVDLEPLHFVYNLAYFATLVWVARALRTVVQRDRVVERSLELALTLQLWHVFEHYLKIAQYLALGMINGTGGFFGAGPGGLIPLLPVPALHFVYNTAVFVPLVIAFARNARPRPVA